MASKMAASLSHLDSILNVSNATMMPAGHHPDSNSMDLPLLKSAKTCLGGTFCEVFQGFVPLYYLTVLEVLYV